jgi:hypothetical protein
MHLPAIIVLVFLTCNFLQIDLATAEDGFIWDTSNEERIELLWNNKPALVCVMPELDESSPGRRIETSRPFHHIFSPDGSIRLTRENLGKQQTLCGMTYGFSNFTYGKGKTCDLLHCTGDAHQQALMGWLIGMELGTEEDLGAIEKDENPYDHVSLCQNIYWHPKATYDADGRSVQSRKSIADEHRVVGICRRIHDERQGWEIDFMSMLHTRETMPIHLGDNGNGAGLRFCATEKLAKDTANLSYYLRPNGKGKPGECLRWDPNNPNSEESINCKNRRWTALCFVLNNQRYTVLCIEHPTNPKPSYYDEDASGCFGASFSADISRDESLTVIYRLWIQQGELTVNQCEKLQQEFVNNFSSQLRERYLGTIQLTPK